MSDEYRRHLSKGLQVRLEKFRVRAYRNIIDSGDIRVDSKVTCLVGKNEAGKTALIRALHCLKPAVAVSSTFDTRRDYPRWLLVKHRRDGSVNTALPVTAEFAIENSDREAIDELVGPDVLESTTFRIQVKYDGSATVDTRLDEKKAAQNLLDEVTLAEDLRNKFADTSFGELLSHVAALKTQLEKSSDPTRASELDVVVQEVRLWLGDASSIWHLVVAKLRKNLPVFFYFDEYSRLPGRIDIAKLEQDEERPASSQLQAARSLVRLSGSTVKQLKEDDYEERKAELEAVSNDITDQVFQYWKQNQELQVEVDIDKESALQPDGTQRAVAKYLDIRVRDRRHGFTSNFDVRSSGFQWFFSFLAAFSEFEEVDNGVVVLLDEPGLALHGKAQADFLRFIDERLASRSQVIYTTHSPFMVEMGKLDRIRVVEDKGALLGSQVSEEVLGVQGDTLFPLQAALGYDIAQSLFVGDTNLLVEGTSDFTYLTVLSDFLESKGASHLDKRWRILPAGGAQNVPAFVALLGRGLEVTVLVDSGTKGMQRLDDLSGAGLLAPSRLLTVGNSLKRRQADVEDLFTPGDFLTLYNGAFGANL